MKANLLIVMLLIGLMSCNTNNKNKEYSISKDLTQEDVSLNVQTQSKGYELMKQKCYICHFETPDPSRKDQMIAPPMLRVQEHYKPTYPNKDEFVKAVIAYIKNPSEEKTLMPGAVKKFNLMPKLIYDDAELGLIAEAMYDYDFGSAPKMGMQMMGGNLQLNNGEKWVLKKESMEQIDAVVKNITNFKSTNIEDYNKLGKDVFNDAKIIMLDDSYTDELFDQIHMFFSSIENNMHTLMATESIDEANKQVVELNKRFKEFHNYFE